MHFDECDEGDYRIYAGALHAGGGYVAAVVVFRVRGIVESPQEAFRDMAMSEGRHWNEPDEALVFAMSQARETIRAEPYRLRC